MTSAISNLKERAFKKLLTLEFSGYSPCELDGYHGCCPNCGVLDYRAFVQVGEEGRGHSTGCEFAELLTQIATALAKEIPGEVGETNNAK